MGLRRFEPQHREQDRARRVLSEMPSDYGFNAVASSRGREPVEFGDMSK
jgi:hypothetical protein